MNKEIYDITIIGGGPVGLFAAFYAGLRNAKVKIIESLEQLGGQPQHLYPMKNIYDIPAYPQITGGDLTDSLIEQVSRFQVTYCLGETATSLERKQDESGKDYYQIQSEKDIHHSRTIILAAGNGAFTPRALTLDGSEDLVNQQIHYYIKDLNDFHDKNVVICGGGDSAVDWALALDGIAKDVAIVHRRDQFRALESSVNQLRDSSVKIHTPYTPAELIMNNRELTHLQIQKARSHEKINLDADQLIVSFGFSSSLGPLRDWGFEIQRNSIVVNDKYETNLPGVYAIGDIAQYSSKVKIIATGFGEAPSVVNSALTFIDPNNSQAPVHSSELINAT